MADIQPFKLAVAQADLDDLALRLEHTRLPERETPDDWSQGVPLAYAREVIAYWRDEYDWRARERYYNEFPQFRITLQGLGIHFIHIKSPSPSARPLLLTHGWPGSVVEFHKVLAPLVDPVAHGGQASDAFHVVAPSLPGYGFSDKPTATGWGVDKIAAVWDELMSALGYAQYFAQGGDWGAAVTTAIGLANRGACQGIHVNMPTARASRQAREAPDEQDKQALARARQHQQWGTGYSKQQSTRPQTVGYGLMDSPLAQAMWIIEKFHAWSDCNGHPENVLSRDELLDNVMFYWLPGNGASSARLYWESFNQAFRHDGPQTVSLPTGCSIFPEEIVPIPRSWAETRYTNIVYWNELDKGGHFAAFEQPELFVAELRTAFALMR